MIATCKKCEVHPYQDKKYGTNKRVFTKRHNGDTGKCTVCGKQHSK